MQLLPVLMYIELIFFPTITLITCKFRMDLISERKFHHLFRTGSGAQKFKRAKIKNRAKFASGKVSILQWSCLMFCLLKPHA